MRVKKKKESAQYRTFFFGYNEDVVERPKVDHGTCVPKVLVQRDKRFLFAAHPNNLA